jgi:hypothetical protein
MWAGRERVQMRIATIDKLSGEWEPLPGIPVLVTRWSAVCRASAGLRPASATRPSGVLRAPRCRRRGAPCPQATQVVTPDRDRLGPDQHSER